MKHEQNINTSLSRNSSGKSTRSLDPLRRSKSTSSRNYFEQSSNTSQKSSRSVSAYQWLTKPTNHRVISTLVHRILNIITFPNTLPKIKSLFTVRTHGSTTVRSSSSGQNRIVSGTLFGQRRGHVSFAVHNDKSVKPILLVELEISTAALVEDISTGNGRIVLECSKTYSPFDSPPVKLVCEQKWRMYCKGRKFGYARSRACTESDCFVLNTIRRVTVGAGVIPAAAVVEEGGKCCGGGSELVYMRAKFERVVGSSDSEAFYMMNPDTNGGPEFSIFLLRKLCTHK